MRSIGRTLLAFALFITAACDPGMSIRQDDASARIAATTSLVIHVRTTHPLIGETWYSPGVDVQNVSDSPISVTKVELRTKTSAFQNKPRRSGTYPAQIPPKMNATLDVWFDLAESVKKTFQ